MTPDWFIRVTSHVWRDVAVGGKAGVEFVQHGPFICVTWFAHMCDMTHWWYILCVTWLIRNADGSEAGVEFVQHGPFRCVTWLIFICVTWLIHSTVYTWHDSFTTQLGGSGSGVRATWPIQMCATTRSYLWHDSFITQFICDLTHSQRSWEWSGSGVRATCRSTANSAPIGCTLSNPCAFFFPRFFYAL